MASSPQDPDGAEQASLAAGMPRWVKVFVIIAILVAVLFVVLLVVGGGHGPSRHGG